MKIAQYYGGTDCVEIIYKGYNWLVDLDTLKREAEKLIADTRRICKAAGVHNEFSTYHVKVNFEERELLITIGNADGAANDKIMAEAKKRHFKLIRNGKPADK